MCLFCYYKQIDYQTQHLDGAYEHNRGVEMLKGLPGGAGKRRMLKLQN